MQEVNKEECGSKPLLPAVNIASIFMERIMYARKHVVLPNCVILHMIHKPNLWLEMRNYCTFSSFTGKNNNVIVLYGMKIIWTIDVEENEITCFNDGR